jgi:hypothetical protein
MSASTTQPIGPGMAHEINLELARLGKAALVRGIRFARSHAGEPRSVFAESQANLEAEYRRRYGKDLD